MGEAERTDPRLLRPEETPVLYWSVLNLNLDNHYAWSGHINGEMNAWRRRKRTTADHAPGLDESPMCSVGVRVGENWMHAKV